MCLFIKGGMSDVGFGQRWSALGTFRLLRRGNIRGTKFSDSYMPLDSHGGTIAYLDGMHNLTPLKYRAPFRYSAKF